MFKVLKKNGQGTTADFWHIKEAWRRVGNPDTTSFVPDPAYMPQIEVPLPQLQPETLPINKPATPPMPLPWPLIPAPAPATQPSSPELAPEPDWPNYPLPDIPLPAYTAPPFINPSFPGYNPVPVVAPPVVIPGPGTIPEPGTGPSPEPNPQPQPNPGPSPGGGNSHPPTVTPGSRTPDEDKGGKFITKTARGVYVAVNFATEANDFVMSLYDAIPKDCRREVTRSGRPSLREKYAAIYHCWDAPGWDRAKFIESWINNQVEDWFYGQIGRQLSEASKRMGVTTGLSRAMRAAQKNMYDAIDKSGGEMPGILPELVYDETTREWSWEWEALDELFGKTHSVSANSGKK